MIEDHHELTMLGTKESLEASRKICHQLKRELFQAKLKSQKKKRGDRHYER